MRRQLDAPILGTAGLAQAITAAGLMETSRVLRVEEGPAGDMVAHALGTDSTAIVQWVERVRYADGEPLALDLSAPRSMLRNAGPLRAETCPKAPSTACSRCSVACA